MRVYVSHAKKDNFMENLYNPIKNSELTQNNQFIFPHEGNENIDTEKLFRDRACDIVLAEVSVPSTGQGIELGYAKLLNVPIICIYKKGSEIAGSLKWITNQFIEYSDSEDFIKQLKSVMKER